MEKKVLLRVKGLKKYFPLGSGRKREVLKANDGIDLEILKGETVGLVGESGSGKSTFGRAILQFFPLTEGSVSYVREDREILLSGQKAGELRPLRKELQMIFQDPYSSLDPRMNVGQIIGEGLGKGSFADRRASVLEVMERCGLPPYVVNRYPHQFSGGQRQRVGIARALAGKPRFVVCDEAVSALDVSIQSQILNLLLDLKEQDGLTYLFISHDLGVVRYISDRIGVMYLGVLAELAETEELFRNPLHPYTEALLSAIPTMDLNETKKTVILEGDIPSPVRLPSGCRFHTRCVYCTQVCREKEPELSEAAPGHFAACHHPFGSQGGKEEREVFGMETG